MADDAVAQFIAVTESTPEKATQYLSVTDNNVEQAVSLFLESGGADLGGSLSSQPPPPPPPNHGASSDQAIPIDDDEIAADAAGPSVEDDEAMARRLQNEAYGSGGAGGDQEGVDPQTGVRAPMARTTETLADPMAHWQEDEDDVNAAVLEQIRARQARRQQGKSTVPYLLKSWF